MQWLELPDGRIVELTGSTFDIYKTVKGRAETRYSSDAVVILQSGNRIRIAGETLISLVTRDNASRVMLNSSLGTNIIKALFSLADKSRITALQLAEATYDIAFEQATRPAVRQRVDEILEDLPGA